MFPIFASVSPARPVNEKNRPDEICSNFNEESMARVCTAKNTWKLRFFEGVGYLLMATSVNDF